MMRIIVTLISQMDLFCVLQCDKRKGAADDDDDDDDDNDVVWFPD